MKKARRKRHALGDLPSEYKATIENLLDYAKQKRLRVRDIGRGWSIYVDGHALFHIEMQEDAVGVVPQFLHLRTWNADPTVDELRRRLHDLLNVKNPQFLLIFVTTLLDTKALNQLYGAFDWFLGQI